MNALPSSTPPAPARCIVSVILHVLNDEDRICVALESCLSGAADMGAEFIVADTGSTDRTVELASRYPVHVVRVTDPGDQTRGAGVQLGFQHSRGEYVLLMDGSTSLAPGFLTRALAFLALHPEAAGVGGRVAQPDPARQRHSDDGPGRPAYLAPQEVRWIEGGALYRRRAIAEVGHLADRNLHSHEAIDLAVRLRARSWKLWRIASDSVIAPPCAPSATRMQRRREDAFAGFGELLRAAASQRRLRRVWRAVPELRNGLAVLGGTASLLRGLMRHRRPPGQPVAGRIVHQPPQTLEPQNRHYA